MWYQRYDAKRVLKRVTGDAEARAVTFAEVL
jgi:hypothetical protein